MKIENLDPNNQPKTGKSKRILIFVILICVIGLGYFLYSLNKSNNTVGDYERRKEIVFTIAEYDKISENFKKAIFQLFLQNEYLENGSYFFTRIPNRAKKVIAYGNFSNKKEYDGVDIAHEDGYINDDIAFVLEKNDFKSSVIYIMSESGNLLYYQEFEDELPTISSFKKGAKIFMNDTVLQKAPSDGILVYTKDSKKALLYVPQKNIFEMFYQYTNEDLEDMENEEGYVEDYEESDSIEKEVILTPKDTAIVK